MLNSGFQLQEEEDQYEKTTYIGFKGRMFPLLGFLISTIGILVTYYIAVTKVPRDVKPFPWTDITHTAIHFPEYVVFRIALLIAPVLFCISFQMLKNYLQIKCFEILGQSEDKLKSFTPVSIISSLALCVSTATISDGGDMNWTLHTIGATSFFILALWMVLRASTIYRKLWSHKHFCSEWSYKIKKYSNFILLFIIGSLIFSNFVDIGSFVQWFATFYLIVFFLTLFLDFKDFDVVFERS